MAIEKFYRAIAAVSLTGPGGSDGTITLTDTIGFKVKMRVLLEDPVQQDLTLEVKRVNSTTELELGPIGGSIKDRIDLSLYSATSTLAAIFQKRPDIPLQEIDRAVFEEEPTVAIRVKPVDYVGDCYTLNNPFPVSINGVNPNIPVYVQLTHEDDNPNPGDIADSIRIGSGTPGEFLLINPDGSINANIVSGGGLPEIFINTYAEVSALAGGATSLIVSYTVPVGKTSQLLIVEFGGSNFAIYEVTLNGTTIAKRRTYWGGQPSDQFDFGNEGLMIVAGDVVALRVDNYKVQGPNPADFEGRILAKEIG